MAKEGIPADVLKQLDIKDKDKQEETTVTAIVEEHQAKLPIPAHIRMELGLKKGQKCKLTYNETTKELTYKFK